VKRGMVLFCGGRGVVFVMWAELASMVGHGRWYKFGAMRGVLMAVVFW
jgi:hypothetical protein